ncbi:hypothetical protein [Neobacillus niacini]|uniref:hypothetical protein n=1 Tax=Neobacillus niacini TaxID=86668 RepID=UPI0028653B54|nr:hypothetical protein [Neobacillus niacini]MDR7002142.1 hypothetical protein [Neobacillus niacini]
MKIYFFTLARYLQVNGIADGLMNILGGACRKHMFHWKKFRPFLEGADGFMGDHSKELGVRFS